MDVNAIVELFRRTLTEHYFDTKGRVGRPEFWWFMGACVVISIIASILDSITGLRILNVLAGLALLLPTAGMGIRRLQDTGRNGTLVWVEVGLYAIVLVMGLFLAFTAFSTPYGAVVYFGAFAALSSLLMLISLGALVIAVALVYFWIQPGNTEANQYGPPPPVFSPNPTAPKAG